jgi:diguanylate cyclase (GGDEF)-like protein
LVVGAIGLGAAVSFRPIKFAQRPSPARRPINEALSMNDFQDKTVEALSAVDAAADGAALMLLSNADVGNDVRHARRMLDLRTDQLLLSISDMDAFVDSVSHDFRAPLRHVLGFLHLLEKSEGLVVSEEGREYMGRISTAARRMAGMTADLLSFARLGRLPIHERDVSLDVLVRRIQEALNQQTEGRQISWLLHPLPTAHVDEALFHVALLGLLSNAVKFTAARQVAVIEVGCVPGGDDEVVLFVRDNGAGFNQRYASRLFRIFRRLHAEHEFSGSGLGLAGVRQIIQRHGGRVWAEGTVDVGATFFVSVPSSSRADARSNPAFDASRSAARALRPKGGTVDGWPGASIGQSELVRERRRAGRDSGEPPAKPVRVLFVEDSQEDTVLAVAALKAGGFAADYRRVESAAQLQSCLELETWDGVISDFQLPGMSGMDALAIVRASHPDMPFILVSGTIGEDLAVEAIKSGASEYIMKESLMRLAPALSRELRETASRQAYRTAQRNLIASEERFRRLAALSSDWYWEADDGGRVEVMSPSLGLDYKKSLEAWMRREMPALSYERRGAKRAAPFRELELNPFEHAGVAHYVAISGEPLFDPNGRCAGYRGVGKNITERINGVDDLRRFQMAMDAMSDAVFLVDRERMCFVHVNDAGCRLHGLPRADVLALDLWTRLEGGRGKLEDQYDALIASNKVAEPLEMLWPRSGASPIWIDVRRHAQCLRGRWTIVSVVRDITAQRAAADRLKRLNRLYATVSGVNAFAVRARNREELYRTVCRVVVEQGQFEKAWIGVLDEDGEHLAPVASHGVSDRSIARLKTLFMAQGQAIDDTTIARVMRNKEAVVFNNQGSPGGVGADGAARKRSRAIFPLITADEVMGVLFLQTAHEDFFDGEGMQLLTEVGDTIAFATNHLDKQARLDYLAYYDALTGLANRRLFLDRLAQYVRVAAARKGKLALFLFDLERFKAINHTLGRAAGDVLLKQVSEWLIENGGDVNTLARVAADQFAVVLPEVREDGNLDSLLDKSMTRFMEHHFVLGDASYRIAAKVGAALFPADGADGDTLFKNAEAALRKAKVTGDRHLFYADKMTETMLGNLSLENQLRQALGKNQFVLHYQPKVDLRTGKITGAEALIRWNSPDGGLMPPARFIPILEQTGMIREVGAWALRQAVSEYLRWLGTGLPAVPIAVNVSPLQLRNREFVSEIAAVISVDPRAAAGLELEITETLIMEDVDHSIGSLAAIRAMGVNIAVDDFGTGFSSLSDLAKLPVGTLKIDRSFVVEMTTGPEGSALVSGIINLAHALKLTVVAEGVETEEQQRELCRLHCDEMQGFLFGRPVDSEIFQATYLVARDETGACGGE